MRLMPASRFARWFGITLLCILLAFAGFLVADHLHPLPIPAQQNDPATVVTDMRGRPLRAFANSRGIWRYQTRLQDVSPAYIEALLHYEDRWFYYHPGINPLALIRAALQNMLAGYTVSGGSTITMQVARIFDPHARTYSGKLRQAFRAMQLEWHFSKDEILNFYLNFAPFGGPVEGVAAASYVYLDKAPDQLTHAEAALLAVLPQRPTSYRPDRHPERARRERDKVLDRMTRVWPEPIIRTAKQQPVDAVFHAQPRTAALFARFASRQQPSQAIIRTTLDLDLQQRLEDYTKQQATLLPRGSSIAILIVDHHSMQVKSYIGSANYNDDQRYGYVDMVQAIRSPGPTLQPLLYAIGIDDGLIHSQSLLSNEPEPYTEFPYYHLSGNLNRQVSLPEALQGALAVPALQVLQALGVDNFIHRLHDSGIVITTPPRPNPTLILDGAGVSLWELVKAFSAFANRGKVQTLQWQKEHTQSSQNQPALLSEGAAWIMRKLLSEHKPVFPHKAGEAVADQQELAWTSGLTPYFLDEWAIGINPRYTLGIWVGRPDSTPAPAYFAANRAVQMLSELQGNLIKPINSEAGKADLQQQLSSQPDSVTVATLCMPQGTVLGQQNPANCARTEEAWLLDRQLPPGLQNFNRFDPRGNPYQFWNRR